MKHAFKKVILIILDGFGLAAAGPQNPISIAGMAFLNSLIDRYPSFNIISSGLVVGLPWGKPGNSEVGHSAIGTGRVVVQDWARINGEIVSGNFFSNAAFLQAVEHCRKHNSRLHIVGCASPGGIHAHEGHLMALLELAARERLPQVAVHMITDGEDAEPMESSETIKRLAEPLAKAGASIATVSGRMFAMDRVYNWDLTQQVWHAMVDGKGETVTDVATYLAQSHDKKILDDQIAPAVVMHEGKPVATVQDNDALIFFNYRNDRAKQLLMPFVFADFDGFVRARAPQNLFITTMTRYSSQIPVNAVAYEAPDIHHTLGKEISRRGLKQVRIAEKEKEAHVTNFFNGGRVDPYEGSEQVIVSSRQLKGKEYLKYPEMSAKLIVDEVKKRAPDDHALLVVNFANPDMMAHTGNIEAATKGVQAVDESLKAIMAVIGKQEDTAVVITCDHGNCEELIDPATGGEDTQHSANNVIAVVVGDGLETSSTGKSLETLLNDQPAGSLIDIAPLVLKLLSFEQPPEMTGSSLL